MYILLEEIKYTSKKTLNITSVFIFIKTIFFFTLKYQYIKNDAEIEMLNNNKVTILKK